MDKVISPILKAPVSMKAWEEEARAWSERSSFFVDLHKKAERQAQVVAFCEFVKKHNLLPTQGKACDVGCGVGDYALGLAHKGYDVTAIDLSSGMVEGASQIAKEEGVALQLYVGPWSEKTREALAWKNSFDLVYSIFCPVMHEEEQLMALHKASRKHVLFVCFANRKDTIVDALFEKIYGPNDFDWQGQVEKSISYINTFGKEVTVEYKVQPEEERFTLEAAVNYFAMRLYDEHLDAIQEKKAMLREFLQDYMVDGYVVNKTEDTVAWIHWQK